MRQLAPEDRKNAAMEYSYLVLYLLFPSGEVKTTILLNSSNIVANIIKDIIDIYSINIWEQSGVDLSRTVDGIFLFSVKLCTYYEVI